MCARIDDMAQEMVQCYMNAFTEQTPNRSTSAGDKLCASTVDWGKDV